MHPSATEIVGMIIRWLKLIHAYQRLHMMDQHLRETEEDVITVAESVVNARHPAIRVVNQRAAFNIVKVGPLSVGSQ